MLCPVPCVSAAAADEARAGIEANPVSTRRAAAARPVTSGGNPWSWHTVRVCAARCRSSSGDPRGSLEWWEKRIVRAPGRWMCVGAAPARVTPDAGTVTRHQLDVEGKSSPFEAEFPVVTKQESATSGGGAFADVAGDAVGRVNGSGERGAGAESGAGGACVCGWCPPGAREGHR